AVEVEAVGPTEDLVKVYFTDPTYPDIKEDRHGGLDLILAADISEAQSSVDVAAYDFDLESVARALVDAHEHGVKVRMVTDSDNASERTVRQLKKAGIQIVEDEREALMHNKFVVIDEEVVWTGSWNLTENGTYRNNNNAVRIVSDLLAENYTVEFEEMFSDRQFGPESPSNTPHRQVTLKQGASDEGIRIESFFAPEDQVADMLLEQVKDANKSIRFMAFSFTDDRIGEEVKKKDKLGLKVQGVIEERGSETEHSEYGRFDRARPRLDVLLDGNPYMMHHKVIILDNKTVILGSYNFTRSASDFNDENILFIHDPDIAALFREEFDRVYKQAAAARE
ncbi:MAG TPA: phospholipase D-like domain-containing protein, partial [Anaerolineae bacterium]|nr:phospholipase D-like domain-containing protein [Anaerolineae bacterium]